MFEGSAAENGAAEAEDIPHGKGLILSCEDEPVLRDTTKSILEECGYDVIFACNGDEAIEIFKERHNEINAVLLDLQMPKRTGKEVFIEMKKIKNDAKIILTSGSKHDERIDAILSLGANGFIQKPYTLTEIAKALDDVLKKL